MTEWFFFATITDFRGRIAHPKSGSNGLVLGEGIQMLMPPPYNLLHPRFMHRCKTAGIWCWIVFYNRDFFQVKTNFQNQIAFCLLLTIFWSHSSLNRHLYFLSLYDLHRDIFLAILRQVGTNRCDHGRLLFKVGVGSGRKPGKIFLGHFFWSIFLTSIFCPPGRVTPFGVFRPDLLGPKSLYIHYSKDTSEQRHKANQRQTTVHALENVINNRHGCILNLNRVKNKQADHMSRNLNYFLSALPENVPASVANHSPGNRRDASVGLNIAVFCSTSLMPEDVILSKATPS